MKTTLLVSLLALAAAPAFAAEGNGEPFPLHVRGVTTTLRPGVAGSNQNPFPYSAPGTSTTMTRGVVGSNQNPYPYTAPAQQLTLDTQDAQDAAHTRLSGR